MSDLRDASQPREETPQSESEALRTGAIVATVNSDAGRN
jgi:hypothetical protein